MPQDKTTKIRKRFKIGESAIGGIIEITLNKTTTISTITIEALDWSTKETLSHFSIPESSSNLYHAIRAELNRLTSIYYTDKCIDWIKGVQQMQETRAKAELRQEEIDKQHGKKRKWLQLSIPFA
jgi:hypothetical protein